MNLVKQVNFYLSGRISRFTRLICILSVPRLMDRLSWIQLCCRKCSPLKSFWTILALMQLSLSNSFTKLLKILPPKSIPSWFSRKETILHSTKSFLFEKSTYLQTKTLFGTKSHYKGFRLGRMMDSLKMSMLALAQQNCLAPMNQKLVIWQTYLRMLILGDWDLFGWGIRK